MNHPKQNRDTLQPQLLQSVTGFVLAGGKSSRMGREKALLELSGRTLLNRAIDLLRPLVGEVIVVGEAAKFVTVTRTVEDLYRGHGPLGGIHAALTRTATPLNLILAVDLPFVERDFLTYLITEAGRSGAMVTVPRTARGSQPLCAVYDRDFADIAEEALRAGRNKIDALFSAAETRTIGQDELARMGFSEAMFRNLNTPEEFARAEKDLETSAGRGR